jgi:arginine decarboxylase-like protein
MKKCCTLCYENNFDCEIKECRYWIHFSEDNNCSLLSIYKNGKMNLREIAMREGISYARVKQIQDAALIKLKKRGLNLKHFLYD